MLEANGCVNLFYYTRFRVCLKFLWDVRKNACFPMPSPFVCIWLTPLHLVDVHIEGLCSVWIWENLTDKDDFEKGSVENLNKRYWLRRSYYNVSSDGEFVIPCMQLFYSRVAVSRPTCLCIYIKTNIHAQSCGSCNSRGMVSTFFAKVGTNN